MNTKISVIMLMYNRAQLVGKAIESVLNQTYQDFEFIIIDNGSQDDSYSAAEKYTERDKRIRLYKISKSSIGAGRNYGISKAKGKYVTFIDDDDWMYADMLSYLIELVEKNNADIALCGSDKEVEGEVYSNCIFDEVLIMNSEESVVELLKRKKYNAAYPTKLLKKQLFEAVPFREDGKYDDITVVYKHFALAKKTVAGGVPKYCFKRHESNNSSFTTNDLLLTPEQLTEYLDAFRERTEWLSRTLPDIADYAQYSEWSYMISMCNKIEKNHLENCYDILYGIKKELKGVYEIFYHSEYIQDFEKLWMNQYIEMWNGGNEGQG